MQYIKCEKVFVKGCRDDNAKGTGTRCSICSDDGIRNNKQHEGKGKGWACNNHSMCNPIKRCREGLRMLCI